MALPKNKKLPKKDGRNHFGGPKDGRRDFRNMNNDGKTYNGGFGRKKPGKGNDNIFGGPKDGRRNASGGKTYNGPPHLNKPGKGNDSIFGGPKDGRPVQTGGKDGRNHFGGPDDGRPVLKHKKQGGRTNTANNGPRKGNFYGGRGGYKGVNVGKANKLVGGVIRKEIDDLRKEKRMVRRESRNEANEVRRDYSRGKSDLRHVFGESQDYLGFLNNENQQMYQGQMDQAAAAQHLLQAALGGTYTGAQNAGMAELNRLGISQGGNFSQLNADQAAMQSLANQSGANAQSNLQQSSQNAGQLGNLLSGMNQGSFMSNMGKNLNARNDGLAEVRQNQMDNYNKVHEAMSDVRGQRSDLLFQLLQQLQETGWSQYMDQQSLRRR